MLYINTLKAVYELIEKLASFTHRTLYFAAKRGLKKLQSDYNQAAAQTAANRAAEVARYNKQVRTIADKNSQLTTFLARLEKITNSGF